MISEDNLSTPLQQNYITNLPNEKMISSEHSDIVIEGNDSTVLYRPKISYSWHDFTKYIPQGGIGLDGFIREKTILLDSEFPYHLNFDHHIGDRTLIKSTCSQVFFYTQGKIFSERFKGINERPLCCINHLDGDSVLSAYIIANHSRYENVDINQLPISKLINIEDDIDRNGGIFHGNLEDKFFHYLNWCLQPLNSSLSPEIKLISCFERFYNFENGTGKVLLPQSNFCFIQELYPLTLESPYFHFITAESPFTRSLLFKQGSKDAFISLKESSFKPKEEKHFTYSIGKLIESSTFPIKDLIFLLNRVENFLTSSVITKSNCWGANNLIGGSPYQTQSKIPPELIAKIIHEYIEYKNQSRASSPEEFCISLLPDIIKKTHI